MFRPQKALKKTRINLYNALALPAFLGKDKGKMYPCTGTEAMYRLYGPEGEWMYKPFSFLTTALEGGEGPASRLCHSLPQGKTRYPLYRRLGGPQDRSGQVRKISSRPGFEPGPSRP